jgi:hypothetical protein
VRVGYGKGKDEKNRRHRFGCGAVHISGGRPVGGDFNRFFHIEFMGEERENQVYGKLGTKVNQYQKPK